MGYLLFGLILVAGLCCLCDWRINRLVESNRLAMNWGDSVSNLLSAIVSRGNGFDERLKKLEARFESRELNAEERKRFDEINVEADRLTAEVEKAEAAQ